MGGREQRAASARVTAMECAQQATCRAHSSPRCDGARPRRAVGLSPSPSPEPEPQRPARALLALARAALARTARRAASHLRLRPAARCGPRPAACRGPARCLLPAACCRSRSAQLPAQPADAASASTCITSVLLPPLSAAAAAAATATASAAAAPCSAACSCCAQLSHTSTGAVSSCTNLQSRRKQRPFCTGKAAAGREGRGGVP